MKKTPLYEEHIALNGRMVEFGGWSMPVQYSGLKDEHFAVRGAVGLFDVSHMGEVSVRGKEAFSFVQNLVTNDVSKITDGQAQYTVMCNPQGGIVDDLLVYRFSETNFLLVINAANIEKDFAWMKKNHKGQSELKNVSDNYFQIALQGPKSNEVFSKISILNLSEIGYYRFAEETLLGQTCIVSRTGYTGEDGFEIYGPSEHGKVVWQALLDAGTSFGIKPCGLGCRDTLRLEAKMALYGNDIDEKTNPYEAGLGWVVKLAKNEFIGKEALAKVKAEGPARKLVGLEMIDRGIPRHDYPLLNEAEEKIGIVTSGTMSPTLNKCIALGYLPTSYKVGDTIYVGIRDKKAKAQICKTPFYQRTKE